MCDPPPFEEEHNALLCFRKVTVRFTEGRGRNLDRRSTSELNPHYCFPLTITFIRSFIDSYSLPPFSTIRREFFASQDLWLSIATVSSKVNTCALLHAVPSDGAGHDAEIAVDSHC